SPQHAGLGWRWLRAAAGSFAVRCSIERTTDQLPPWETDIVHSNVPSIASAAIPRSRVSPRISLNRVPEVLATRRPATLGAGCLAPPPATGGVLHPVAGLVVLGSGALKQVW